MSKEQHKPEPPPPVNAASVPQNKQPHMAQAGEMIEGTQAHSLPEKAQAGADEKKRRSSTHPTGMGPDDALLITFSRLANLEVAEKMPIPPSPGTTPEKPSHPPMLSPGLPVERMPQPRPLALPGPVVERIPQPGPAPLPVEQPPRPLVLPGPVVERTPQPELAVPAKSPPRGYTPELEQKETTLLPARRWGEPSSKRRKQALVVCVSALLVIALVSISVLALRGRQSTPVAKAPTPVVTPTPSVRPIEPFPTTLQAQIDTLEAHDRFFYNGNTDLPEVALTFDDGPNPAFTPQVLAILKASHVKATFFDLGSLVEDYPDLARQELQEGHVVGNHTWLHPDLTQLSEKDITAQIQDTQQQMEKTLGSQPSLVRPPYGALNSRVLTVMNKLALTTVIWNDEAKDWSLPGTSVIVSRVLQLASNGAIILLHDGGGNRKQTVDALPTIIQQLRARGYSFVTVNEMIAHIHKYQATPTPQPGQNATPSPQSAASGQASSLSWWDNDRRCSPAGLRLSGSRRN